MKYWAIVGNVWKESWARKTAIILTVLVTILLAIYAFGFQLVILEEDDRVLVVCCLGGAPARSQLLEGFNIYSEERSFAVSMDQFVLGSGMAALGLLSPWGILLGLFITVGTFTRTFRPRRLYWLLAKPISRSGLLLSKYGGAVSLVFVTSMVFVASMAGLIAWKSGEGVNAGLLLGGLLFVFNYAVLASLATLVAVWTQNTGISLLGALLLYGITALLQFLQGPEIHGFLPDALRALVDAFYLILPKLADIEALASRLLSNQSMQDLPLTLGSSATFLVAMLGLSLWEFRRRDY